MFDEIAEEELPIVIFFIAIFFYCFFLIYCYLINELINKF